VDTGSREENATKQKVRAFSSEVDTGSREDPKGRVSEHATRKKLEPRFDSIKSGNALASSPKPAAVA
jgi:hypothetical protein